MAEKSKSVPAETSGQQSRAVPAQRRMADPFMELRDQVDRVFDSFFGGFGMPSLASRVGRTELRPLVDVSETDDALMISADLPGMDEKDIDVTITNGILTLKGEKRAETERKDKNYHMMERSYGSFTRSFRLPETVDEDKCSANFEKGVLTITLPKTESAKQRVKHIAIGGNKPAEGG